MQKDPYTDKKNKRNSKWNTTREQMKLIDKLNQARKDRNFWKLRQHYLTENREQQKITNE